MASIKSSGKKHFGGFDNLTASGVNRFETLLKLASKHRIEKAMTKTIQNGKRYLKTNYQMHCNTISYPHILLFSLSDTNKTCLRADSETSNKSSDDFRKLTEAIYKINQL